MCTCRRHTATILLSPQRAAPYGNRKPTRSRHTALMNLFPKFRRMRRDTIITGCWYTGMSKNLVGTSLIGAHNLLPPDMNRVNEPYKKLWEQVPISLYVPTAMLVYSLCSSFSGGKLCSSEDLVGTWI